jgi:hypothetical protein
VFTQTRRLFRTAPARTGPVVCEWPATASAPEWTDDLDSLFRLVDERMVERRVVWAPEDAPEDGDGVSEPSGSAAARAEDGRDGPPPTDTPEDYWIGFGIVEETGETFAAEAAEGPVPPSDEFVARVLVTGLLDSFKAELRALVEATVRDAVDAAVKDQVRNAVREYLDEAVREAVQDAASPARSSPALVSILVRRPVFRPRDASTREPATTLLRLRSTSR